MATKAKSNVVNSDKPIGKKKPLVGIVDRLFKVALPLVNAHNVVDTASDAVSACRKDFFTECVQALGKHFYTKEKKHLALQAKKAFYLAHYDSKGMKVSIEINTSRNELKLESLDGKGDKVKAENANAGTRWSKFVDWCKDEDAGLHKDKDPNNRQSKSGNKRTLADIVKDNGQRLYNAFYKAGKLEDCQAIKAICARYKHTCTVPAGSKK